MSYVPLWCKSNFSFLEGASHPDELIEEAHRLGLRALALTDRDGVYGMVRAHAKARELGVQLLCGAQVTVVNDGVVASPGAWPNSGDAAAMGGPSRNLHAHEAQGPGPGWGLHSDEPTAPAPVGYRRTRSKRKAANAPPASTQLALGALPHSVTAFDNQTNPSRAPHANQPLATSPLISSEFPANASQLVLLAQSHEGWRNLSRLLTLGRRRCAKGSSQVTWQEVCDHAPGLLALWGGRDSALLRFDEATTLPFGYALREAFGDRLYGMLTKHRHAEDGQAHAITRARARALRLPLVATPEVLYHSRARRPMQDVVACIRAGVTLATAGHVIRGNDEYDLRATSNFAKLWAEAPAEVARSLEVASRCEFALDQLRYRYPSERLPSGISSAEHLRNLTWDGARQRYGGGIPADVANQLTTELALIEELDYPGYFLTMHEIVAYCRRRDIICQGRGSAANSAVCYCLGITAIDPVRMGLLFERFLSRERAEPPDIDLDIEHERREEVIQHVYYVYGRRHAAMVCNIIRYRARSAVRDVGKVLGIPETAIDRAAKLMSYWSGVDDQALAQAGLAATAAPTPGVAANQNTPRPEDDKLPSEAALVGSLQTVMQADATARGQAPVVTASTVSLLAQLASELVEFPRHLSVHPGGFLLGHEPVHDIVPIENASMADRTVIQWDKDDLETLGLFKVDLLALGALHHLHLCFDLLRKHHGTELTMATLPAEDAATYDMLCTADTVGVFQVESRAQMAMLPRLRPRTFYDLVVEISLVRPGPISGGMVHPYLRRRRGEEPVIYPHPSLAPVLAKTLGVPLFQEQVMKLAVVAADYTPGEADQLRRDMAAWRRSGRIEKHRDRLISRMEQKGIAREFGERVFEQIRGFGEYGFPESHAASFALIAYATAWLRCHYIAEFTCALLNALPMGFYSAATIVGDAQRHGVTVLPIDVASSEWPSTLVPSPVAASKLLAVRMGLRWIKGLTVDEANRICQARNQRAFANLQDFVRRTHISSKAHNALSQAGALGSLAPTRRDALWQTAGWAVRQHDALVLPDDEAAATSFAALTKLDEICWDFQASDHSTRGHPLAPLRSELTAKHIPAARALAALRHGQRVQYVGIVICRQRPATASGVTFMTLEDETGFVNVVIWPHVWDQHQTLAKTTSLLGISGKLQIQERVVHLVADELWQPQLSKPVADVESRNFH